MEEFYLKVQKKIFATLGYNLNTEEETLLMKIVTITNIVVLVGFVFPMAAFVPPIVNDVDLLTESLCSLCTGLLSSCKVVLFRIQRKNFIKMAQKFKEFSKRVPKQYLDILIKENRVDTYLSNIYYRACVFTGIASVSAAFVKMGYYYYTTNKLEYILPFNGLYPYNYKTLPTYIFTILWTFYTLHVVISGSCSVDTLFNSFAFNLAAHYKILQQQIQDLKPSSQMNADVVLYLKDKVKNVLIYHQDIIATSNELNSVFKPVVFMQFFISSFQACVIAFQLALKLTDPMVAYFGLFLSAIIIQLFIYSYGGNRIRDESEEVATAIYLGYWYLMPPKLCRDLLIAIQRGQRGNGIDSIFFDANLPTFNTILSSAMSYITILRSFEDN